MKGVTGTMAGLGHVPRSARRGLYGLATIVFPIVYLADLDVAKKQMLRNDMYSTVWTLRNPLIEI